MKVIQARNVHHALPIAVQMMKEEGVIRQSRNGPVIVYPYPVTTVYQRPEERVVFWPERDANPFLHLYESLWMIMGREDVTPLLRYAKQFAEYSDDGQTLHDAYGYRWRHKFNVDQLALIIRMLTDNRDERRAVLQMWDANCDLGRNGKAVPCNLTATFQINHFDNLDMVVFNRSNDLVWGAYGANAVHFSFLQEYIATHIGVPVGNYTHVTANLHAYPETFKKVEKLPNPMGAMLGCQDSSYQYLRYQAMPAIPHLFGMIEWLVRQADEGFPGDPSQKNVWGEIIYKVLKAHHIYKITAGPERYSRALEVLSDAPQDVDWVRAAQDWILRREDRHINKMAREHETLGEA